MVAKLHACSFHGNVVKMAESGGIRLTEVLYGPDLRNPRHSHANTYIGITLDGYSTQLCESKVRSSQPWTVMFHPAGETHSDHYHEEGARELNIEVGPAKLDGWREYFPHPAGRVDINGGKASWLANRLYSEFRLMDECSWLAIEGLTIELMAEILRRDLRAPSAQAPPWLKHVWDSIHERYAQRLTLGDLAATAGVHRVHLAREFHRRCGCTIGQQIRQLRIERACELLANTAQPLVEVALAAGFSDQSHFTKTFKTLVGITPCQYRCLRRSR